MRNLATAPTILHQKDTIIAATSQMTGKIRPGMIYKGTETMIIPRGTMSPDTTSLMTNSAKAISAHIHHALLSPHRPRSLRHVKSEVRKMGQRRNLSNLCAQYDNS